MGTLARTSLPWIGAGVVLIMLLGLGGALGLRSYHRGTWPVFLDPGFQGRSDRPSFGRDDILHLGRISLQPASDPGPGALRRQLRGAHVGKGNRGEQGVQLDVQAHQATEVHQRKQVLIALTGGGGHLLILSPRLRGGDGCRKGWIPPAAAQDPAPLTP